MLPWLFLIFRDKRNGARVILQKYPESIYIGNMSTIQLMVTWCVTNFGPFTTLTFQYDFKCKTCLAKYDHWNLICEESSYTMTWYEEKTDLKCAWRFLRTNKKSHFWGYSTKFICYVCFTTQIRFWCKSDKKWTSAGPMRGRSSRYIFPGPES